MNLSPCKDKTHPIVITIPRELEVFFNVKGKKLSQTTRIME